MFDTFPEGIAIVKDDGNIMYSNDSLARLFECDALPRMSASQYAAKVGTSNDHADLARKMLQNVKVRPHDEEGAVVLARDKAAKDHSVWDFLVKNKSGATFEVLQSPVINATIADDQ